MPRAGAGELRRYFSVIRRWLWLIVACTLLGSASIFSSHSLVSPTATVILEPTYTDSILRGSATFSDADGDLERSSTYRWLVNGSPVAAGDVPQRMLLPMDGSLLSRDGEAPLESQGLVFGTGRFGQAVIFSQSFDSRLGYAADGNVDPNEGSIEMWVNLTYDLIDSAYDDYPRLFSYTVDDEHQFYLEVNTDRILITGRNGEHFYGGWPDPPGWLAGEWHHLAATWSASDNRRTVYYDCVQVAESEFPGLTGTTSSFNLGSAPGGKVMDAILDDVRLSGRALSNGELSAACTRGGPAPNDEVGLPVGQTALGDEVTLEITPCDETGACGAPASASSIVTAPPLGNLEPTPRLLPSGTTSVFLSLTTTLPAECRWSEQADMSYGSMPYGFQQGQGTIVHGTVVGGFSDLVERMFYVRCQDLSAGRDPDGFERQTHLRVLGPWDGGYPRIANMWGTYDPEATVDHFAAYDLSIPFAWSNQAKKAEAIRAVNPSAKVLLTQNATYGWPEWDPLTAEWWNSSSGDPGYNCLLRDSSSDILLVESWGHPMYNMTEPYCRTLLAQRNIEAFLSPRPDQGASLAYDGIYWDRLHGTVSWLGDDVDSDLDGTPDNPEALDSAYQAGIEDFLSQVRARLAHAVLVGNAASQAYATWINGRLYEWHLAEILDAEGWSQWDVVMADYRHWSGHGHVPRATIIESAPEALYFEKYGFEELDQMPPAMEAEAAASYQRMRFGLTSALMGDGLFSYDYSADWHSSQWWYDEFGALSGNQRSQSTALPYRGYLGQPTGEPALLKDALDTPDQMINGSFEDGLNGWHWWVDSGSGAIATLDVDATGGIQGTPAAHFTITGTAEPWTVGMRQTAIATSDGQSYTLSFWARSSVTRTVHADLSKHTSPWTDYGIHAEALVTPQWQHLHLWDDATATADDGRLQFQVGDAPGELWLDEVQFQAGALGVWARPFESGLVVVNSTNEAQTAALPGMYCKLHGDQAPLFQVRVDDGEAQVSAGWSQQPANDSQFGNTVQVAPADNVAAITYTPDLAYSGIYEVLAWVTPTSNQSSAVSVTVRHAQGESVRLLDQKAGDVGWHTLGTYSFDAEDETNATLVATGNGAVVSDDFKWVSTARYNDGSRVNEVILQPQDGVILLHLCHGTPWQVYVPLTMRR